MPENAPAEINSFLDELRGQGVDSTGRFTLDPKRARELLQRFRLKDPGYCLLHLVSFLVGAGAPKIELGTSKSLTLTAPGISLDEEWVRAPLSNLFGSRQRTHLTELAIGVHSALGVEGTRLFIRSDRLETRWQGEEHDSKVLEFDSPAQIELQIKEPVKGSAIELLQEHFTHCPTPIFIDGEAVCAPTEIPPGGLEVVWQHPDYPLLLGPATGGRYRFDHEARVTAYFHLGSPEPGFEVLCLGRRFALEHRLGWDDFGHSLRVILATDRLDKDLSQSDIVENKTFENLLNYSRDLWFGFLNELVAQPTPRFTVEWELLEFLAERIHAAGQNERALDLQFKLYQKAHELQDPWVLGRSAYRMGLLLPGPSANYGDGFEYRRQAKNVLAGLGRKGTLSVQGYPLTNEAAINFETAKAHIWFSNEKDAGAQRLLSWAQDPAKPPFLRRLAYGWALPVIGPHKTDRDMLEYVTLLLEQGQARTAWEALITLQKAVHGRFPTEAVKDRFNELMGLVASELGLYEEAVKWLTHHVQTLAHRVGNRSRRLGPTIARLARLSEHLGDQENAGVFQHWAGELDEP